MKRLLLLFNLLLLKNCTTVFSAEEPAPKRQKTDSSFTFKTGYFTKIERQEAEAICYDNDIAEYPEKGANQTSPDDAIKCIKIYNDKTFIGFMVFKKKFEDHIWKKIYISHLFISKAYQRQGLGTRCMNFLFKLYPDITTFSLNANEDAITFYQKFGFKKEINSDDNLMIKS